MLGFDLRTFPLVHFRAHCLAVALLDHGHVGSLGFGTFRADETRARGILILVTLVLAALLVQGPSASSSTRPLFFSGPSPSPVSDNPERSPASSMLVLVLEMKIQIEGQQSTLVLEMLARRVLVVSDAFVEADAAPLVPTAGVTFVKVRRVQFLDSFA